MTEGELNFLLALTLSHYRMWGKKGGVIVGE